MIVTNKSRAQRYLSVFARSLIVLAGVFLVTYFSAHYFTDNFLTKYYTATAQIEILRANPSEASVGPAELQTILSPDVLLPVVKDLGLDSEWSRGSTQEISLTDTESIACLDKMLRLDSPSSSDQVNISVIDTAPKEASDIANAIAARYQTLRNSETLQAAAHARIQDSLHADRSNLYASTSLVAMNAPSPAAAVLREGPVRIVSPAVVPTTPSKPSPRFLFYVPLLTASLAGLMAASFVEVIFLFVRAAEVSPPLTDPKPRSLAP